MRINFLFLNPRKSLRYVLVFISLIMLAFVQSSCYTTKTSAYFRTITRDTVLQGFISNDFESKIQKKDILGITVSSLNRELDDRFNAASLVTNTAQSTPGYLVNDQGEISVHYVGTILAEGFTRKLLKDTLEHLLNPYLKDPIISIQYLNHKMTVLGEVMRPQVLNMPEEQLSLIDVIVSSGDVKENAKRSRVMVIREEKNQKKVKLINLEDNSIFSSPWYYVQPNDIVYVLPDTDKYVKEENRRKLQTTVALIASLASLAVIILNVILR